MKNIEAQASIIELNDNINSLTEQLKSAKRKHEQFFTETTEELTRAYTKLSSFKKLAVEAAEEKKLQQQKAEEEKRVELQKKEMQEVITLAIRANNASQQEA